MKKVLVILVAVLLVVGIVAPPAALAWDRGWHGGYRGHGGHWRHGGYGGHGGFWPGYAFGAFTGLVLGGALAAPYYAAPPPYFYAPPPPSCYTQGGYWTQVPYISYGGYTTYQNVWVPAQTVCR